MLRSPYDQHIRQVAEHGVQNSAGIITLCNYCI